MFQIIFNKISAAEMSSLPRLLQLEIVSQLEAIPENPAEGENESLKVIERDGRQLIRARTKDHRIYLERTSEGILVHRVISKNSLRDFLFRSGLPTGDEDEAEADSGRAIWKLVEEGERSGRT